MTQTDSVSGEKAAFDAYVDGFLAAIREGRPDPVRELVLARLMGQGEPLHGLSSPPLGLHEPDQLPLLYHIYRRLVDEAPESTVTYFRRVLMELYCDTLHQSPPQHRTDAPPPILDELARLVAYCHVADTPLLARQLLCSLWGYLATRVPEALENILAPTLTSADQDRAWAVLDLWVATARPNLEGSEPEPEAEMKQSQVATIERMLDRALSTLGLRLSAWESNEPELLFLLYRAAVKANPRKAGAEYFGALCRIADRVPDPSFAARWQVLCWRVGRILETSDAWKNRFLIGLEEYREKLQKEGNPPARLSEALEMLGLTAQWPPIASNKDKMRARLMESRTPERPAAKPLISGITISSPALGRMQAQPHTLH